MELDHLMWACSDLDAGIAEIEQLTGVVAEYSGSHRGLGTRNALLSLGDACYLEIIAPDPAQNLEGNFGGRLSKLTNNGLLSFAMMSSDLPALKETLRETGIQTSRVTRTTRDTAAGDSLEWDLLFVQNVSGAPFYIDWLKCVHPAVTSPSGCQILGLEMLLPDVGTFQPLVGNDSALVKLTGTQDDKIQLRATIESPRGRVMLEPIRESIALF